MVKAGQRNDVRVPGESGDGSVKRPGNPRTDCFDGEQRPVAVTSTERSTDRTAQSTKLQPHCRFPPQTHRSMGCVRRQRTGFEYAVTRPPDTVSSATRSLSRRPAFPPRRMNKEPRATAC